MLAIRKAWRFNRGERRVRRLPMLAYDTLQPDTNGMVLQWQPQTFSYAGRQWKIMLRHARVYHPFSLTLLKVEHDVYAGTDIPKNFSSRVRINNPDGSFNGVVLATLYVDYFRQFYDTFALNSDASLNLLLADGTILYRRPYSIAAIGKNI